MIDHHEIMGFPVEDWSSGFEAVRKVRCTWADRHQLAWEFGENGGQLYPYLPQTGARAVSCNIMPFSAQLGEVAGEDVAQGMALYDEAHLTVRYSLRAPEYIGQKFVTEEISPSGEFTTLDESQFFWDAALTQAMLPAERFGKLLVGFNYNLTFHYVAAIPPAADTLPGYVNASDLATYTLNRTFAAETLLYRGYGSERTIQPGRVPTWRLTYVFSYRPVGWNMVWNPAGGSGTGAWSYVYHASGGGTRYLNYPLGNFSLLT